MAFPVLEAESRTASAWPRLLRSISLPSGIQVGERLVVVLACTGNVTTSLLGGWTEITDTAETGTSPGVSFSVFTKQASGSDFAFAIHSGFTNCVAWSGRISGAADFEAGTVGTSTNGALDLGSSSPSWGAEDTFWLSVFGFGDERSNVTTPPTSYGLEDNRTISIGSLGCGLAVYSLSYNTASEDPTSFAIDRAEAVVGIHLAVRPVSSGQFVGTGGSSIGSAEAFGTAAVTGGSAAASGDGIDWQYGALAFGGGGAGGGGASPASQTIYALGFDESNEGVELQENPYGGGSYGVGSYGSNEDYVPPGVGVPSLQNLPQSLETQNIQVALGPGPASEDVSEPKVIQIVRMDIDTRTPVLEDLFAEGSDTALESHTPDTDTVGGGWEIWAGSFNVIAASDDVDSTSSSDDIAAIDSGLSDLEIEADITMNKGTGGNAWQGLVIRGINNDDFMWVKPNGGTGNGAMQIGVNRFGEQIGLATTADLGITGGVTYNIRVWVKGDRWKVYLDDVEVLDVDLGAYDVLDPFDDATYVGLYNDAASTNGTWDNLSVKAIENQPSIASAEAFGSPAVTHNPQTIAFEPELIIYDSFQAATPTNIKFHQPDTNREGGPYHIWNEGQTLHFQVDPGINALEEVENEDDVVAAIFAGTGNQKLRATIWPDRGGVPDWPGLMFRGQDEDNFLFVDFVTVGGDYSIRLRKREGGSNTTLATGSTLVTRTASETQSKEVEIEVDGNAITVKWEGTTEISHTLTGGDETTFAAAVSQYVGIYEHASDPQTTWDDFYVWDLDSGHGVATEEAFGEAEITQGGAGAQNIDVDSNGIASGEAIGEPDLAYVIKPNGIASGEAIGEPDLAYIVDIDSNGIASGEAIGEPAISQVIAVTGIASGEAFGSHVVTPGSVDIDVDSNGIASAEAIGSATINPGAVDIDVDSNGISSGEAFGSATVIREQFIHLEQQPGGIGGGGPIGGDDEEHWGIASGETLGEPSIALAGGGGQNIDVDTNGIASAEAIGEPAVVQIVTATGIGSGEAIGEPAVVQIIDATGIASGEAIGEPAIVQIIKPTDIVSGEAFGDAEITTGAVNINLDGATPGQYGIESGEAFGSHDLTYVIDATGVASGAAFGDADLVQIIDASGIASGVQFGSASVDAGAANIVATGIASGEAIGSHAVAQVIKPSGIASGAQFGSHDLAYLIAAVGIESDEEFGSHEVATGGVIIVANGIPSGEAFGTPVRVVLTKDGCATQILEALQHLQPINGLDFTQTVTVVLYLQTIGTVEHAQTILEVDHLQTITACERGLMLNE